MIRGGKLLRGLLSSSCRVPPARRGVSGKAWIAPSGFDTGIKAFNSLSKRKEALILAREGTATWYSCGPTVYDHAHLGHACSYVRFDILQRILTRLFGVTVIHAMVITDIDDKIIRRSWEEDVSPAVLARMYEEEFKRDMLSLKVLPPAVYLRVTENVPHIVAFIDGIIRNGHAYATKDGGGEPFLLFRRNALLCSTSGRIRSLLLQATCTSTCSLSGSAMGSFWEP